ncbi:penicillin acylase family protein [Natrononativus amylolyticus]|uniref:penicillin acylase family protein n=1 Tax=Natrononativus amylolyticus TaxID=2963434 RepID=UPI0020CCEBE2|nr:penicillin acylase family protein [Natrononativus amylolyticus]
MATEYSRRAALAAVVAAGVGGLSLSGARGLLEAFAPLSGTAWDAAGRERSASVSSPHGEATVRIDDDGVPHVEADDEAAAYFAVGYCHGFDRPFQLDLQRRVMRGQLSELVGEATLSEDEFHVAMDFAGAAEATWEPLEGTTVGDLLAAYADGVNRAFEGEQLTLEFELLGYEPRPWTPVDTLLMEKQISWDLTGNFGELRRALLADRLGEELLEALYPERMDHDVPILREGIGGDSLDEGDSIGRRSQAVGRELTDWLSRFESPTGVGSNSWLVSGEHTGSGTPIVANDPHLTLMTPPLWYEQHVRVPDTSVRGVTFPGVPFVIIGANERSGWGFTNVGADVLDCYRYEIDDEGERYRYGGEWRAFDVEEREIAVAGGESRSLTVKKTIHGPLIEREEQRVGVAWTGLTATRTTEAIYEIARADDLEGVLEATHKFDLPTQNLTYADADGRTLYYATGQLPIREVDGEGVSGNRIFDGSAGEGEWDGFVPYGESSWEGFVPLEEKPHVVDPDVLATANQRVADDPDHYVGVAYATPYRGRRIYDELDARLESDEPLDAAFHRDLQGDVRDERAPGFVSMLFEALEERGEADGNDETGDLADAADTLENWEYRMERDSEGALLFDRWLAHYRRAVFEPLFADTDLGESYYPNDWVLETLSADSRLFEDVSREELLVGALEAALAELEEEGWAVYGDRNTTATIEHPFGVEAPFLDYEVRPTDGSPATVNNYRFESAVGSSWRMVVEPGEGAWAILPGGNSGDYFSDHYDDQFRRWVDAEFKPMNREPAGDVAVSFEEGSS